MKTTLNQFTLALFGLAIISPLAIASAGGGSKATNIDAGVLGKQVEQNQIKPKEKPGGELFAPAMNKSRSVLNDSVKFKLTVLNIVELDDKPVTEDLSAVTKTYLNQDISLADLESLTQAITQYYRKNNLLVARAILPPQEIENGVVTIKVVKGEVGNVLLNNQSKLRDSFVSRMAKTTVASQVFMQKDELERLALLLNDVPAIKPALSLRAGTQTGKTDLYITLQDSQRFQGYISADNQGNKTTGRYRLSLGGKARNLLGFGDELKLDLLSSNKADLQNARLDYSGLIDGYGTRLGINANFLRYELGGNFKALDASGSSQTFGAYLQHPTIRTPDFRLNTRVAFNHQILKDKQNAVNLHQERKINTVSTGISGSWNSIRNGTSYFSLSALFGNENNQTNEKAHYLSEDFKAKRSFSVFNYALSHEQVLPKDFAINLAVNGQLTDKNLDSSQKMLLGGLYAVRGYTAGAASVDEGHIFQAEIKHYLPLFKNSILTSSIFYDYGFGKFYKKPEVFENLPTNKAKLQSIGAGLSISAPSSYSINLSWAKPIGTKLEKTDSHLFWLNANKVF